MLPTVTLPKLRLVELSPNVPTGAPLPESGTVTVGFDAFERTEALPLAAPEAVGVKVMLKLVF